MLHINFKGIERKAPLSLQRPLTGRVGSKDQNIFLNMVMLDIKSMGKKYRPT